MVEETIAWRDNADLVLFKVVVSGKVVASVIVGHICGVVGAGVGHGGSAAILFWINVSKRFFKVI